MNDLMRLWKARIDAIIGIVQAGQRDHRELANIAAQVGADYHGRFIVELLQNASDQAAAAGLQDSCATIVRTDESIFFANEGLPFDEDGLLSITSIGLSSKDPQVTIGNKGIGFKSVFQISESPEIYSSSSPAESFADAHGLMFKLSQTPFATPIFLDALRNMVTEHLAHINSGDAPTLDRALSEIKAAAPFKFPVPLSATDLTSRLMGLSGPPRGQTLVVLPLRQGPEIIKTVENAIDELFGDAGAAILFLPSVSEIRIIDHVRGYTRAISRRIVASNRGMGNSGELSTVITTVQENDDIDEQCWRVVTRRMGTSDVVTPERGATEAECINSEARKLPGTNWDLVKSSPVGVAVPLPKKTAPNGSLLGAHGRICIGLPTKDMTGTPAWVNAHFYGTIARTGIDLSDNGYNAILFSEIVRLHEVLITDLKADSDVQVRRAATLAFERNHGPLADVLYAVDGQAKTEIILSADGGKFQSPADTVLPELTDVDALLLMMPQMHDLAEFGLKLPELELTGNARSLIEDLIRPYPDSFDVSTLLLDRSRKNVSVLELAAVLHRGDGPGFWDRFLSWAVDRFPLEMLCDQRLLPIGKNAIAKSSERVFLPLSQRRSAEFANDDDGEIPEIPTDLAQLLKFLDEDAVSVRKSNMHSLTELASKLAPDASRGLVRSPRLDHLINDAVGPLMQALKQDEPSRRDGIALLRQAIQWLWALSDVGRGRLTSDALRVPVLDTSGRWLWVPPSETYFGPGWLDSDVDSLLQEAYGHECRRILLSWDQFSLSFSIPDEDRNRWINALEFLGVSRSPKLIRPRGSRIAPLVSFDYSTLSIIDASCPIAEAELFWRPYLEVTRKRTARTATGQPFDFRSITWIDGLEREASRAPIIKLMLLNSSSYESEIETFLERQFRRYVDETLVPSLWVHAIAANTWDVIPTSLGTAAVADAWLLDGHQRGLARRRLALLKQVEPPYDAATKLLHGIGVTTLQTASVSRLVHAIDQLGSNCDGFDADTRRVALALAKDLFGHLQAAFSKTPAPLPDLRSLRLPLERNGEAVCIRGDQIVTAYFDDDPVRAKFIPAFSEAYIWPLDNRRAYKDLVSELKRQLGESAVVFTSDAPVESRFTEDHTLKRITLLEWLSYQFPQYSVASDLAALIAYTGRETDPNGEEFQRIWRLFEKTSLVVGTFDADVPTTYFYDRTTGLLQVAATLSSAEKVEATWMLVGLSYRDTWSAYTRELDRNTPGKFLTDRQITPALRENVDSAINLSSTERFNHVRAAILALWRVCFGQRSLSLFEKEWNMNARSARGLCEWLGRPDLVDLFALILGSTEEEAALAIIRSTAISSEQWQEARFSLGMARWHFTHKKNAWNDMFSQLVSILKTCAARASNVSPTNLEPILRDVRLSTAPERVACRAEDDEGTLKAMFSQMQVVLGEGANIIGAEFVRRRLTVVVEQAKTTLATVDLDDAPARDVRVYRYDDESKRSRDAQMRFDGLMFVATHLATRLGEHIATEDVRSDSRVALLLNGWWANSFSVIPAMQRALQTKVPKTAQRLSDERAFRDPAPANELLERFKELADLPRDAPAPPPKRNITILGQEHAEDDVAQDLFRGSAGNLGQQLKEKAALNSFEPNLGRGGRHKVLLPDIGKKSPGGGGRGAGNNENKKDREFAGLIGEIFVYEHYRFRLSGFDEMAWRSCNRSAYGLGVGDDSLGYDFLYRDVENQLAGRADHPLCHIEVKSSSRDGSEAFPMSANEWECARECHQTANLLYIILRVAHVRYDPKISDMIIDPFGLYGKGQVGIVSRDIWVHVGTRQPASTASNHKL